MGGHTIPAACRVAVPWPPPRAQPLATGRRTAGDGNMTETIPRGAANQAGAHLNKNAYEEAQDFLPRKGIDHVAL